MLRRLFAAGCIAAALAAGALTTPDGTSSPAESSAPDTATPDVSGNVAGNGAGIPAKDAVTDPVTATGAKPDAPGRAAMLVVSSGRGRFTARVHARPVIRRDPATGRWEEAPDLTPRAVPPGERDATGGDRDRRIDTGRWRADWNDGSPGDYAFSAGGATLAWTALHDGTGIDVAVEYTPDGVKETLTLAGPETVRTLMWHFATDALPTRCGDGFEFRTRAGEPCFTVGAVIAWDAAGTAVPVTVTLAGDTLAASLDIPPDAAWPVTVDPTTTVTADDLTACYGSDDSTYTAARADSTGAEQASYLDVGQHYTGSDHYVKRSFLTFDLSGIPDEAVVSACSLYVDGYQDFSDTDFDMYVVRGTQGDSLGADTYNDFEGWSAAGGAWDVLTLSEAWNSSAWSSGWNAVAFNAAGVDTVDALCGDASRRLRLALLSSRDIAGTAATGAEFIRFSDTGATPYVAVTYTVLPSAPESLAASDTTDTGVTLAWTDTAGNEAGFRVRDTADTTVVATAPADSGGVAVTGLLPDTTYHLYVTAYNAHGESAPSDTVTVTTSWTPAEGFTMTAVAPDSIVASWTDHSLGTFDYLPVELADSTAVAGADTSRGSSVRVGGLGPNTFHRWLLKDCRHGTYTAPDSAWTLAATPGRPSLRYAGGDVSDESENLRHGSNHGAILARDARGPGDHAYRFADEDAELEVADIGLADGGPATVAMRFVLDEASSSLGRSQYLFYAGGLIKLYHLALNDYLYLSGTEYFQVQPEPGVWHHAVLTWDGDSGSAVLYLDGTAYPVRVQMGTDPMTPSDDISFGRSGSSFEGMLDDVRVYRRALTGAEADSLRLGGTVSADSLALWYTFDTPDSLVAFTLDDGGNPSWTAFAVQDSVSGAFVDATAEPESLRAGPAGEWAWRTFADWGGAAGDTLSGARPGHLYVLRAKARNGE